ncbi:MAG: sulfotransferase family protein, partial [Thermoplasmatota archaeon]
MAEAPARSTGNGWTLDPFEVTFTPLAGSTFTNLLRLLVQNRFRVDAVGMPRVLYSLLMSFLLGPLNLLEKLRYDDAIRGMRLEEPPVFIVGHWRSGTTFLHNILSQDSQFAFPTTFQTVTPGLFLRFEKLVKPIVAASLPEKRPEDNVDLGPDLPQEEEYAMGNLSPYAFYNGWCFPRNMSFYHRYVCMDDVPPGQVTEWKQMYHYFLQKVALAGGGRRLVVKNPANTARVKLLLEMYPEAKFVHIYRNPYHVYLSMKRNIETEMTLYCVQSPPDWSTVERQMIA